MNERSSLPSKNFSCFSIDMLQIGALVLLGRLVEAAVKYTLGLFHLKFSQAGMDNFSCPPLMPPFFLPHAKFRWSAKRL